jgi:hypothetical protein
MRYACSYCHTPFEAEPAPILVCPNCKAEAGIEQVHSEPPKPMQLFGVFLLVAAVLALGGVVVGVAS